MPTKPTTDDQFEYTTKAGKTITLPRFQGCVNAGVIRRIRYQSEGQQFFTILEKVADDDTLELIDELSGDEFAEFRKAWYKHSGISLGE